MKDWRISSTKVGPSLLGSMECGESAFAILPESRSWTGAGQRLFERQRHSAVNQWVGCICCLPDFAPIRLLHPDADGPRQLRCLGFRGPVHHRINPPTNAGLNTQGTSEGCSMLEIRAFLTRIRRSVNALLGPAE